MCDTRARCISMITRRRPCGRIIPCRHSAGSTTLRLRSSPNRRKGRLQCFPDTTLIGDIKKRNELILGCRMIGIGFSSPKASVERLPGWEQESWAYHGDDGKSFIGESQGQGRPYGPTFGVGDTVGCGVNFSTGSAFFTKNGNFLGMCGVQSAYSLG